MQAWDRLAACVSYSIHRYSIYHTYLPYIHHHWHTTTVISTLSYSIDASFLLLTWHKANHSLMASMQAPTPY